MVRFRAEVGKDRLAVIAFNDLAEHLDLADGDTVNVIGRLQGTSWEGQDGGRRYGWQVLGEQVEQAGEVCEAIRAVVRKLYGARVARAVTIQYGGSMNAKNAAELLAQPDIDGGLIGGASLKAQDFTAIVNAANQE